MATALEVIRLARLQLERGGGWTKGAYARDQHGRPLQRDYAEGAASYCLVGALHDAARRLNAMGSRDGLTLALAAVTAACGEAPDQWNDAKDRQLADVLALLDDVGEALA
jgi:putative alpha-1,2-mannosidase